MSSPPTIEDVANRAGVSVATVSRALRDLPNVAPATRARVEAAAAELDYRPDPSASALASGRTKTIAMAVPMLDSWYFSKVMAGAETVLAAAGYDLLVFAVHNDDPGDRLLHRPVVRRADALIVVDIDISDEEAAELAASRIEVVAVGMKVPQMEAVVVDDHRVAFDATMHLVSLGHTRIALIGGVGEGRQQFSVPIERRAGFVAAMTAAGLALDEALIVDGGFSVAGGHRAMADLMDLTEPPTAVFAMSDEMAFGALRELWDRDMDAPADVSVIGVDNHDVADLVGLTTMQQQVVEHGAQAARLLLRHLLGEREGDDVHVHTGLIERSSTGPPRR